MAASESSNNITKNSQIQNLGITENHQAFKKLLFCSILIVAATFSTLFGLMHYIDINPLNDLHANVNFTYAGVSLIIFLNTRNQSKNFQLKVLIFLIASHITFTSAFINVEDDKFRGIWFYLLILVTYILSDSKTGLAFTFAALATMTSIKLTLAPGISDITFTSMMIGLVIMGLIVQVFTSRVKEYVDLLNKKNEQLLELAKLDSLTGIYNSRKIQKKPVKTGFFRFLLGGGAGRRFGSHNSN
ncbi:MAG: hypothetical protein K6L73_12005 [Cellvibrionaceae bacterium]